MKFRALYREVPEALYENERVVEMASYDHLFNGFLFPRYETDEPGGAAGLLRREVFEGAVRRYGSLKPEVCARIEYELGIITQKVCRLFSHCAGHRQASKPHLWKRQRGSEHRVLLSWYHRC